MKRHFAFGVGLIVLLFLSVFLSACSIVHADEGTQMVEETETASFTENTEESEAETKITEVITETEDTQMVTIVWQEKIYEIPEENIRLAIELIQGKDRTLLFDSSEFPESFVMGGINKGREAYQWDGTVGCNTENYAKILMRLPYDDHDAIYSCMLDKAEYDQLTAYIEEAIDG